MRRVAGANASVVNAINSAVRAVRRRRTYANCCRPTQEKSRRCCIPLSCAASRMLSQTTQTSGDLPRPYSEVVTRELCSYGCNRLFVLSRKPLECLVNVRLLRVLFYNKNTSCDFGRHTCACAVSSEGKLPVP